MRVSVNTSADPIASESGSSVPAASGTSFRIQSIDIFRGLTVLTMIFVDNLGFVKDLPWWTYHMPAEANGMTYVDMVFPAFLFLMGMAIPLSVETRRAAGDSPQQVWVHVVLRSLTLVGLGLFIANAPSVDPQHTHLSGPWWTTLGFLGIALLLLRLPGSQRKKAAYAFQRGCGLMLLLVLAVIFRRATPDGHVAWLDFSDWEILGLLGWAYLLVSALYLLFGKKISLLASALAVLVAINALSIAGRIMWLRSLPFCLTPFEAGLSSITLSGLLASLVIVGNQIAPTLKQKTGWVLGAAVVAFAAGWMLRPLGISKIRDTPTWCLYCISANLILVLFLYWLADVQHKLRWAGFLQVVGANALLAYFLPYTAYLLPKLGRLTADGTSGAIGVARSLAFTGMILTIVLGFDRARIRLRV
jgi:heparan-alpha-glucosaminide N-acetyltransferase